MRRAEAPGSAVPRPSFGRCAAIILLKPRITGRSDEMDEQYDGT
ncbi:hypothetical protein [Streptomyces sp. AK010]|nr:hypothetical protein [Streptomyces sp. AK010]MBB6417874.1 hypothetical protein [Streptomyces sp. AK010]